MDATFLGKIGCVGFFGSGKTTKMSVFTVNSDGSPPSSTSTACSEQTAGFIATVCFALILHILCMRRFAQIGYAVISRITINVIYIIFRPRMSHIEKCETMGFVGSSSEFNDDITVSGDTSCNTTNRGATTKRDAPRKQSCLLGVFEKLDQSSMGDNRFSHDCVSSQLWLEGSAALAALSSLRHFNIYEVLNGVVN